MKRLLLVILLLLIVMLTFPYENTALQKKKIDSDIKLYSLKPEEALSKLNLNLNGLESVKSAFEKGDKITALSELLKYYRNKYPLPEISKEEQKKDFKVADEICKHIFQWGPYESADYGKDINWEWDPRGDIEWVAGIYRFYWAIPLAEAYKATRDEKYAQTFVELSTDWITKHPLEKREKTHPVYSTWRGFAWLDIQTGIRATNLCRTFKYLVNANSFTPEFLGIFLATMYDHQVKTEKIPMNQIHNKAIFEQRGFVNVAFTFPEFKESKRWMELALKMTEENLLAQTTTDGVQREWSGGYHNGVLRDAVEIMQRMNSIEVSVSKKYRERVKKMYDYVFAISTPDLGFPMFGDASRPLPKSNDRSTFPHYDVLIEASEILKDPKYSALAKLDLAHLPKQKSYAFPEAGMYVMRNKWEPDQIYFALHCSPPAISSHDQPDNGTFELYAYGKWLMTDTGFYTYGHDPKGRAWHRQTSVHQTLTLDGKDSKVDAKHLIWHSSDDCDAVAVENKSYDNLLHRRTVWFVDKTFFVLLDEVIGNAEGDLDLHFQLALGDATINSELKRVTTNFDDTNLFIWTDPNAPVSIEKEEGWFAWQYGFRKPRIAFRFRNNEKSPTKFLTLLVPYKGKEIPDVSAEFKEYSNVGANRVVVDVKAFGKSWLIGRDLKQKIMWCKRS
jgi:heparan-sulfate lyase